MLLQRLQSDFRFALVTLFGTLTSLCITPIAAYRFATGAVVTGFVDLGVVACIMGSVVYMWRGGSSERAGMVAVLTASVGCVVVAKTAGLAGLLWIYPTMTANYLLVRPRYAVLASLVTVGGGMAFATGLDTAFATITFGVTAMLVSLFSYIFAYRTESQRTQLEMLVTRDTLTAASNRRAMEQELPIAMEASRRARAPVGLLVMDIDHFKRINDGFGHETGDHVLVDFTRLVIEATRKGDRLFRYGGEEFVLLLPGMEAGALAAVAETLRSRVAGELSVRGTPVTVSIGAAELAPHEATNEWLARADAAMYRAKNEGRDRVVVAPMPERVTSVIELPRRQRVR